MLLLAHIGIPLGIVWGLHKATVQVRLKVGDQQAGRGVVHNPGSKPTGKAPLIGFSTGPIDYRLVLLGSMLADIIDKPLGTWVLRDSLGSGRVFGHTLALALVLAVGGLYLRHRNGGTALQCLAFGALMHLYLDEMWLNPRTLLWPLRGWSFLEMDVSQWAEKALTNLVTKPSVYVPEIMGAFLLGAFSFHVVRRGQLRSFLRTGQVK